MFIDGRQLDDPSDKLPTNTTRPTNPHGPARPPTSESRDTRTAPSRAPGTPSSREGDPQIPRRGDNPQRRDSGFSRTYDEHTTRRAGPCDNCALTIPSTGPTPRNSPQQDTPRGPILRSTVPCNRPIPGWPRSTPPSSRESAASDSEGDDVRPFRDTRARTAASRGSVSSSSGRSPASSNGHLHYMKYLSTKEPIHPDSYTLVRASCIRSLSFETLPRSPTTLSGAGAHPNFITTHSAGYAASGGPMFFGDARSGYTTAYIFRISDVHARGHKRVYAFLAISTHQERQVMQKFEYLARRFHHMAAHIQHLAEVEAEKGSDASNSPVIGSGPFSTPSVPERTENRGSSFLNGTGGFGRRHGAAGGPSVSLKARGLAELVGQPDFFYQMHMFFAKLLYEIEGN